MPIDAGIYGETRLFQPNSPAQTAAQIAGFQELARRVSDQKQEALDQTAMQQAVQQSGGDYEKAIASLNQAGRVSAAQSLQGAWDKHQEAAGKALEAHLKAQDAQLGYYSHLANLIGDDASQKAVLATLSPEDQQRVSPLLGQTYDAQRVASIRDVMLDGQKRAQIQHEALQDWLAGGKSTQEGVTTLAKYLSATPQAQWGQVLSSAKSLGIPQASLDFVTQNVTTPEQADALANKKEESDKLQSPEVEAIKAWSREHDGAQPTQKDLEQIHRGFKEAGTIVRVSPIAGPAGGELTPEGIDYAATQYRLTGKMPPLGMGRTPARAQIINAAAKQAQMLGQSPVNSIQKQAAYAGDSKALAQMQKMSASAEAFETKALGQAQIVDDLSDRVPRTFSPLLNKALLYGQTEIAGNKDATSLLNAIQTFTTEYAKIMTGSTNSSAASTDSARKEAATLLSAAMSRGTLKQQLNLMRREMSLTMQGYDATINHISDRMGGQPMRGDTVAAPAQATLGPYDVQAPNGKVYHFSTQAQSDAFKKAAGL